MLTLNCAGGRPAGLWGGRNWSGRTPSRGTGGGAGTVGEGGGTARSPRGEHGLLLLKKK
jgi:hypothetical protein